MMLALIVSFSISTLGFAILKHEIREFFFNFGLKMSIFTLCMYFLATILLVLTFFSIEHPMFLWMGIFFLIVCARTLPFFARSYFESEIQKESLGFLDKIILNVSTGASMKSAMDRSLEDMSGWRRRQFRDLTHMVFLTQNVSKISSGILKNLADELIYIHLSQVKTLEQLQKVRRNLKLRLDLRHRSRTVALNMNVQAGFLIFIFVGVSFFSYSNYETKLFLKYLLPAMIWFIFGCLGLFYLQRNHKWKI
ncbi:MAG: hypothetical protein JNL11_12840 [Bdellovibrionaceae bacterium]|nr:hypothetical protein [Pseudobdellovibrionaceae bacterium]